MKQYTPIEQVFADYLKPFLKKDQKIELEYRQNDTIYDLVIKENGFVTHIFEVKQRDAPWNEEFKQMSRIKEAYLYSADGDRIEVGVYLAILNNGQWLIFDHRDLSKPLNIKKVLRRVIFHDKKSMTALKMISMSFGTIYTIVFGIHLWRTLPFSCCVQELSPSLVTMGIFSTILLLLPYLLSCVKKISLWGLEIVPKESNSEK